MKLLVTILLAQCPFHQDTYRKLQLYVICSYNMSHMEE